MKFNNATILVLCMITLFAVANAQQQSIWDIINNVVQQAIATATVLVQQTVEAV